MKKFRWEQDQISNMKEYIARFGHGSAKLARQAQSKEKTLDKMVQGGLTEKVQGDHVVRLRFTDVGKLPPPVLQFADVTFGYSPDRVLYRNVRPCTHPSCLPAILCAVFILQASFPVLLYPAPYCCIVCAQYLQLHGLDHILVHLSAAQMRQVCNACSSLAPCMCVGHASPH